MIEVTNSCTGCRACEQVCPTHAIFMRDNEDGFAYPEVDVKKCIRCGLCEKHCHLLQSTVENESAAVFVAIAKDDESYIQSASAGVFAAIAQNVLAQNGCVFGCAYDEHLKPRHRMIESVNELPLLQGSKYVESDLEDCFEQVKHQLQNNRLTLFCGTGCQVAGLNAYLGKSFDNLLTIGLICHGVPSRKLFAQHAASVERRYHESLVDECFRTKTKPEWGAFCYTHRFKNDTIAVERGYRSVYYRSFLNGETYRESCYECRYANDHRNEDLTIGDYWGVERFHPEITAASHPSVILAHTVKGNDLLKNLSDSILLLPSRLEWAKAENHQLMHPTKRPAIRSTIYRQIEAQGFESWERDYLHSSLYRRRWVRDHIPRRVKTFVKFLKRLKP